MDKLMRERLRELADKFEARTASLEQSLAESAIPAADAP
jgi:hypothetical protein